jgi:hypothetical protein
MGCVYCRTRTPDEIRKLLGQLVLPANEVYMEKDPENMFKVMRQTKRTCFRNAFAEIKQQDCVIVGVYPRFKNEIAENAARLRATLAARPA